MGLNLFAFAPRLSACGSEHLTMKQPWDLRALYNDNDFGYIIVSFSIFFWNIHVLGTHILSYCPYPDASFASLV